MRRMLHRRWPFIAAVLLVGGYVALQQRTSRPPALGGELRPPQERVLFTAEVTLPDVHGNTVRLAELRGRVILLNLWATWCYPCRAEMPSMDTLYQDYRGKGLEILAIANDSQGKTAVAPFVKEYGLTFPVLLDPHNRVGTQLQVHGIPTSYLLDKQGRIAYVALGAKNWNSPYMRRVLDRLLSEK